MASSVTSRVTSRFTTRYGSRPLHLVGLLLSFAVALYAAQRVAFGGGASLDGTLRILLWFVGAAVVHDVVLFPVYASADRMLVALSRRRRIPLVNHIRVPALLAALLFMIFWPSITRHSEPTFSAASGLTQQPFLYRWLLITAALFAVSAAIYGFRQAGSTPETRRA